MGLSTGQLTASTKWTNGREGRWDEERDGGNEEGLSGKRKDGGMVRNGGRKGRGEVRRREGQR